MEPVAKYGTVSGILAAILIIVGEAVASAATPDSFIAGADEWRDSELAIEIGVYVLVMPGLFLFLLFLATLVRLLAPDVSAWMTAFTGVAFFVLMAGADVSNSTTASALGSHNELAGLEVVSGFFNTLGFHLGVYAQVAAGVMAVTASVGLAARGVLPVRLSRIGSGIGAVAVVTGYFGYGLPFIVLWLLLISVVLFRLPRESLAEAA
jgi:hypothetical protein